ncbi:MAG: hypothetical protein MK108_04415 [Mariniblastus sp.]|nr:hypothetical protein [Mariniblastus sp.]
MKRSCLHNQSILVTFLLLVLCDTSMVGGQVESIPESLRDSFDLDPYYQKYVDAGELPVLGSDKVSDAAMLEAAWIIEKMIGHRPDLLQAMAENRTRMAVMAFDEYTTDVPEHRHLAPRVYWDRRARGLGATPRAPAVSCAEENLLGFPGDPYSTENICIHEFAHAIHQMGMVSLDPTFDDRLKRAYRRAKSNGLWANTYAISNHQEYWAEAVQSWFGNNREEDSLHNHVNTRQELIAYDAPLADLCREVFGERDWTYQKPLRRSPEERSHLAGFDFEKLPRFRWRDEPAASQSKVLFQTSAGDFELEFESRRALKRVARLLQRVHEGTYSDGNISLVLPDSLELPNPGQVAMLQLVEEPPGEQGGRIVVAGAKGEPETPALVVWLQRPEQGRGVADSTPLPGVTLGRVSQGHKTLLKIHRDLIRSGEAGSNIKIQRAIRLN